MFISIFHPNANGQAKSSNKMILKGIKKKLDGTKGLWVELLNEILWSYYIIPYSTAKDTTFTMVHGVDAILPIVIHMPS